MAKARKLQQKRGWAWSTVVAIVKPTLLAATKHDWIDGEKIPATGGCVVAVNHISPPRPDDARLVPLRPRSAGALPGQGRAVGTRRCSKYIVKDAGQIPVTRMTDGARQCVRRRGRGGQAGRVHRRLPRGHDHQGPRRLADARQDRRGPDRAGDGVPGDPDRAVGRAGHPCRRTPCGRTCSRARRPTTRSATRSTSTTCVDKPLTEEVLHEATDRIMAAITALVEDLRGEHGARRTLRPEGLGRQRDRQPEQAGSGRHEHDARSRSSAPARGVRRSAWCSPTPATT